MIDACSGCLHAPDVDGGTPLQILARHSLAAQMLRAQLAQAPDAGARQTDSWQEKVWAEMQFENAKFDKYDGGRTLVVELALDTTYFTVSDGLMFITLLGWYLQLLPTPRIGAADIRISFNALQVIAAHNLRPWLGPSFDQKILLRTMTLFIV